MVKRHRQTLGGAGVEQKRCQVSIFDIRKSAVRGSGVFLPILSKPPKVMRKGSSLRGGRPCNTRFNLVESLGWPKQSDQSRQVNWIKKIGVRSQHLTFLINPSFLPHSTYSHLPTPILKTPTRGTFLKGKGYAFPYKPHFSSKT